jgi:hypothetical protein
MLDTCNKVVDGSGIKKFAFNLTFREGIILADRPPALEERGLEKSLEQFLIRC